MSNDDGDDKFFLLLNFEANSNDCSKRGHVEIYDENLHVEQMKIQNNFGLAL